jgi:transcriptional regulator GlxA family with amidase domain
MPMAYLAQCRIDRSRDLLRTRPELNITGFASSQYFATVFRAHIGVSPLIYRNSVIIERTTMEA